MYICGSCRGAAVTIMEPGLVGVWQWAPLYDFPFYVFTSVVEGYRHYMMPFMGNFKFLVLSEPLHGGYWGFVYS